MKRLFQILIVTTLVLAIVGVARNHPTLAGRWDDAAQPKPQAGPDAVDNTAAQPASIIVTGSGSYLVGGICKFEAEFKATDIKNNVDSDVPVSQSQNVPFSGAGDLLFPGCHVVHFKQDKIVNEASATDGDWKVCFGKHPDVKMTIYYYVDSPENSRVWSALPTTVEGAYACAPAMITGVYMPAAEGTGGGPVPTRPPAPTAGPGTVRPPARSPNLIQASGTYAAGGVCTLNVSYQASGMSDNLYVEFPSDGAAVASFPDNDVLLFFPGCHVVHYELAQTQTAMTDAKGQWEICFAAPPDQEITIYFYESQVHDGTTEAGAFTWTALPTTVENGQACAPAMGTGVYVPAGQ